jgi:hypothetical protein
VFEMWQSLPTFFRSQICEASVNGFWRSGRSGGGKQDPSDYLLRKLCGMPFWRHPEGVVWSGPIYWVPSGLAGRSASLYRFCSASRVLYEARVPLTLSLEEEGGEWHHMACKAVLTTRTEAGLVLRMR